MNRALILLTALLACFVIGVVAAPGVVVADDHDTAEDDEAEIDDDEEAEADEPPEVERDFGTVVIRELSWDGSVAEITVENTGNQENRVIVSDVGAAANDGMTGAWRTYDIPAGETRTIVFNTNPGARDVISIASVTDQQFDQFERTRTFIDIVRDQPTQEQLQYVGMSGVAAGLFGVAASWGIMQYRQKTRWYDELGDTYVSVSISDLSDDAGYAEQIKFVLSDNSNKIVLILAAGAYLLLVTQGDYQPVWEWVPEQWDEASDTQRILVGYSALLTVPATPLGYLLVKQIWNPDKVYLFVLDAADVVDAARGDTEKVDVIGWYSAREQMINQLDVEGELPVGQSSDGRVYFAHGFSPAKNEAKAVWPGFADDKELLQARSHIKANKEITSEYVSGYKEAVRRLVHKEATAEAEATKDVAMDYARTYAERGIDEDIIPEIDGVDEGELLDMSDGGDGGEGNVSESDE